MIRVLLVDDELPVHEAFDIMLDWHEFGFEKPDSAYDASTALDMMRTTRYDVVITDISMPEMNGIEFMNTLRATNKHVEIIVITGYSYIDYAQQSIRCGVTDYLLKPIDRHELSETLLRVAKKLSMTHDNGNDEYAEDFISQNKGLIEKVCALIDACFRQQLSVSSIAGRLCVHPGYLGQLFRKTTGETISCRINRRRIEWIKHSISIEKMPTNEIIYKAGYNNTNYFYRKFHEMEGKSFSQWKDEQEKA